MADYKAPLRDMSFVLNEVFEAGKLLGTTTSLAETVDDETAAAILEEAGKVLQVQLRQPTAAATKKVAAGMMAS